MHLIPEMIRIEVGALADSKHQPIGARDMHTHAAAPITPIVPPARPIGSNPGIVPPWLQGGYVRPSEPVDDDTPRILASAIRTGFEPAPVTSDPQFPLVIAAR